jgi:cold shock protein
MIYGECKCFFAERGFGFLKRDDRAEDAFVHIKDIERAGIAELRPGDRVSFELEQDARSGKMRACDLRLVKRASQGERDCGNTFVS